MSDTPQGPDWWQASDDKWYPPPRPQMPGEVEPAAAPMAAPAFPPPGAVAGAPPGAPPMGGYPPMGPPSGPPTGPPPPGYPPAGPSGPAGVPGPPGAGGFPPGMAPSPYGGVPRAPSAPNRTPLFIALAVVLAAAVVGLIVVLTQGGDDKTSAGGKDAPKTTAAPRPTTAGGGGTTPPTNSGGETKTGTGIDKLKVVDSGFSTYSGFSGTTGSYGVIVTNTGDETVTNFTVNVAIYDKNDTVIGSHPHTVAKLAPNQKFGIGYNITEDVSGGIGKLDVTFEEGFGSSVPDGAFTVSDVAMKANDYSTDVTYKVASSYAKNLENLESFAVFRDSGGKIVGGAYGFVSLVPAGGRANGELSSFDPIPKAATAEVYVDKGFF